MKASKPKTGFKPVLKNRKQVCPKRPVLTSQFRVVKRKPVIGFESD